jgi:hypothetical protein
MSRGDRFAYSVNLRPIFTGEHMQIRRVFVVTAVLLVALFSLSSLLHPLQTAYSAPEATTLLYDSSLGNTPNNLNMASPLTTTVQYSLSNGTAMVGQDFVASSGTLTVTPGSLSETISLILLPDDLAEPDETFSLQLSAVENGLLGMDTAVFTIEDDDTAEYKLYLPFVTKP